MLGATPLRIQRDYKYLGIKIGHVTHQQSYKAAIQKRYGQGRTLQQWAMSLLELVALLMHHSVHGAKDVFPSEGVVNVLLSSASPKFLGHHPRDPRPSPTIGGLQSAPPPPTPPKKVLLYR